jgi:5-methylcytosine-specific restriction enzyme subunit McrC
MAHVPEVYSGEEHSEIEIPVDRLLRDGVVDVFPEIVKHDIFEFRFSPKRGLTFKAGRYIGIIPINEHVTIEVRPRVPIQNLERVLMRSGASLVGLAGFTRWFDSHKESSNALLDFIADALLKSIDEIRSLGLYKEYQRNELLSSHPRGRLEMFKFAKRSEIVPFDGRIHSSSYGRVIDNGVNQCILAALSTLSRKYIRLSSQKGSLAKLRQINLAANTFSSVSLDPARRFLKDPRVDRPELIPELRHYYRDAIRLSKLLLNGHGVSFSAVGSEFALSSLIIDMGLVFEGYVRNALSQKFNIEGFLVVDGNLGEDAGGGKRKLFEDDERPRIGKNVDVTPDILIVRKVGLDRKVELVIDAKYKIAAPRAGRSEINQVVTYAVRYKVNKAVIVMPYHAGTERGMRLIGAISGIDIYQYTFDLGAKEYEAEEALWASAIGDLCK